MNISSANYCQHEDGINSYIEAVIDGVTMSVPLDPDNRHYAAILKWAEKDGNTITEAD